MLYGYKKENDLVTVVGAASTVTELENWYNNISNTFFKSKKETDFLEILTNPEFMGYKHPAYIFHHSSIEDQKEFIDTNQIKILNPFQVKDFMIDMVENQQVIENDTQDKKVDKRTLEEILNLKENDPWDKRSEEQKEYEASAVKQSEEIRKRMGDHITGQSFDPKSGVLNQGGLKITDVIGSTGEISVKGIKVGGAGVNKKEIEMPKTFDNLKNKTYSLDDVKKLLNELKDFGYTSEEIEKIESEININDADSINNIGSLIEYDIVYKKLEKALEPVSKIDHSNEEIIEIISKRLEDIGVLSEKEFHDIIEIVDHNLSIPVPKPEHFKYCLNQRLTDNPSVGGEGCPVFNLELNEDVDHNSMILDIEYLLTKEEGWEIFSNDMILNTKLSTSEALDVLRTRGFIEDLAIIKNQKEEVRKKILENRTSKQTLTPEEVAKALAGDGTSTVSSTGSYGQHKVGIETNPDKKEFKPGIYPERGAVLDVYSNLAEISYEDLSDKIKEILGDEIKKVIKKDGKIKFGHYNGQINNSIYNVIETKEIVFSPELSVNLKDLGGIKVGDIISRNLVSENTKYHSIITLIENEKNILIISI